MTGLVTTGFSADEPRIRSLAQDFPEIASRRAFFDTVWQLPQDSCNELSAEEKRMAGLMRDFAVATLAFGRPDAAEREWNLRFDGCQIVLRRDTALSTFDPHVLEQGYTCWVYPQLPAVQEENTLKPLPYMSALSRVEYDLRSREVTGREFCFRDMEDLRLEEGKTPEPGWFLVVYALHSNLVEPRRNAMTGAFARRADGASRLQPD